MSPDVDNIHPEPAEIIRDIVRGLLNEEEIAALAAASRVRRVRKGELIIEAGEVPSSVYVLLSGIVRSYLIDASGRESTDCIMGRPGVPVMSRPRLSVPSLTYVEAVTPVDLLLIDVSTVEEMLETSLGLNKLYVETLKDAWAYHWEVERVTRQHGARERYLWFLKKCPELVDAVPARHVATFLGMTPVTLSRLRSSLRDERR